MRPQDQTGPRGNKIQTEEDLQAAIRETLTKVDPAVSAPAMVHAFGKALRDTAFARATDTDELDSQIDAASQVLGLTGSDSH